MDLCAEATVIRSILYDPADGRLHEGGVELIDVWSESPETSIWVAIEDEQPDIERALLAGRFGIHKLAITDALRERHPPKIEPFAGNSFILLRGLDATSTSLEFGTIQLSIFVADRFLVTRNSGRSVSTDHVMAAVLAGTLPPDMTRAALALTLCRAVADRFLPVLLAVEKRLEEMEDEMLDQPTDELLAELVRQKGDLKRILRILQYHTQIFNSARSNVPAQLTGHDHELIDVQEQLDRMLSLARLYYELTGDLMDGYLSLSAHRLNQIMQTLTIVTVVFVPITFMAGLYGMNFENIPELRYRYSYFILLGTMLAVAASILFLFRRNGWIGGRRRREDGR
jgi:magnesium transporter